MSSAKQVSVERAVVDFGWKNKMVFCSVGKVLASSCFGVLQVVQCIAIERCPALGRLLSRKTLEFF